MQKLIILVVIITGVSFLSLHIFDKAEAQAQPLKLEISLSKTQYVVSEPIAVTAKLTNISSEVLKLAEIPKEISPELFSLGYELEKLDAAWSDADIVIYQFSHLVLVSGRERRDDDPFVWQSPIPPEWIDLNVDNFFQWTWDNILAVLARERLDPGTYRITGKYFHHPGQSFDTEPIIIASNSIQFTVVQGSAKLDTSIEGKLLAKKESRERIYPAGAPLKVKTRITNIAKKPVQISNVTAPEVKLIKYEIRRLDMPGSKPQTIYPKVKLFAKKQRMPNVTLKPKQTRMVAEEYIKPLQLGKYKLSTIFKFSDRFITSKSIIFTIAEPTS